MKPHEYIVLEVARERERQMAVEGWTPDHDDSHEGGQMARAAACYAIGDTHVSRGWGDEWHSGGSSSARIKIWPWEARWWKPKKRRHDLVRAAALLVAEIERLDRDATRHAEGVAAMIKAK